jgi:oligopeptide/dipeptide ABC transporter ATP-binding protein
MSAVVLSVENVSVDLSGVGRIVENVSFVLNAGETLALVGESGCGKTMLCRAISGLLPASVQRGVRGTVLWRGTNLLELDNAAFAKVRGQNFGHVFQDPLTSLNPVRRIGAQIAEPLRTHHGMDVAEAYEVAGQTLAEVGVRDPDLRLRQYPHELSGGLRQRVAIAIAVAGCPTVLFADEPTTALDVTVQAGVLALLDRLRIQRKMATLLVTHNLGVVANSAQHMIVMYAGRIVESGPTDKVLENPRMPYTRALLAATPTLEAQANTRLMPIEGRPPDLRSAMTGCRFAPRCSLADDRCRREEPVLRDVSPGHRAACWRMDETGSAA